MARKYFDQKIKDEAIRRYLNGESSPKIAKDMGINSPDLIRKWVQDWRKKHNLSADEYRKPDIAEEVSENLRLGNKIQRLEEELHLVLKILSLVMKGDIYSWEELLAALRPPESGR